MNWCGYSATLFKINESKGEARESVGRGFVDDSLECTGHPKPKHTIKWARNFSPIHSNCQQKTEVALTKVAGKYKVEGTSFMLLEPRQVASSISSSCKPIWYLTWLSGSKVSFKEPYDKPHLNNYQLLTKNFTIVIIRIYIT